VGIVPLSYILKPDNLLWPNLFEFKQNKTTTTGKTSLGRKESTFLRKKYY
jgi:hypothetical protein